MVLNGIILIIILVQIRKLLIRDNKLPDLQVLIRNAFAVVGVLIALSNAGPIEDYARLVIDILFAITIYMVFKREELQSYRNTMYAFIPIAILGMVRHLLAFLPASWEKIAEDYVEAAIAFGFIWMIAMLIIANKQNKALNKARQMMEEEEKMKRLAEEQRESLEILVQERTKEIMEQKEELQQAVVDLKAAQAQLIHVEKMASLGELTAGIAHEIQNPLNFVNNFSEVNLELATELKDEIEKTTLGDDDKTNLIAITNMIRQNQDKITYHGKRADGIVKGMLQHSRTSTGQKEAVDLNAMVDEYVRLSYHGLRAKDKTFNATIDQHLDPAIGQIKVIPQDMGRTLLNIFNNAFYAVHDKQGKAGAGYQPAIVVSTRLIDKGRKWVHIKVRDNGNGIPDEIRDKIFQPFFTTKPTGKGTGLGLSLSYDIVTKGHGGELKLDSKDGEFTEFTIILPLQ
jgi:signal transduction histidine kinase